MLKKMVRKVGNMILGKQVDKAQLRHHRDVYETLQEILRNAGFEVEGSEMFTYHSRYHLEARRPGLLVVVYGCSQEFPTLLNMRQEIVCYDGTIRQVAPVTLSEMQLREWAKDPLTEVHARQHSGQVFNSEYRQYQRACTILQAALENAGYRAYVNGAFNQHMQYNLKACRDDAIISIHGNAKEFPEQIEACRETHTEDGVSFTPTVTLNEDSLRSWLNQFDSMDKVDEHMRKWIESTLNVEEVS
jgi:hypothetical protein